MEITTMDAARDILIEYLKGRDFSEQDMEIGQEWGGLDTNSQPARRLFFFQVYPKGSRGILFTVFEDGHVAPENLPHYNDLVL